MSMFTVKKPPDDLVLEVVRCYRDKVIFKLMTTSYCVMFYEITRDGDGAVKKIEFDIEPLPRS